jgi:pimeloyl-ACP methyl ester carboxylesterase
MRKAATRSVVFVTGAFIGNNCWDQWRALFERRGYICSAPAWPNKTAPPQELRNRRPNLAIASNRLETITDYFASVANGLPEEPILIGHSLGGLIVQLLLQRGIGVAGIAIHPFPPCRVTASHLFFLATVWPAMGLLTSTQKAYMVSFLKWKRHIANGLNCDQQKELFYSLAIPESKLIIRDLFRSKANIDFNKNHPPLLLTSGGHDNIVPSSIVVQNYKQYKRNHSITDYKDFSGHNHLPFEHHAFEEEADFVLYWLQGVI